MRKLINEQHVFGAKSSIENWQDYISMGLYVDFILLDTCNSKTTQPYFMEQRTK